MDITNFAPFACAALTIGAVAYQHLRPLRRNRAELRALKKIARKNNWLFLNTQGRKKALPTGVNIANRTLPVFNDIANGFSKNWLLGIHQGVRFAVFNYQICDRQNKNTDRVLPTRRIVVLADDNMDFPPLSLAKPSANTTALPQHDDVVDADGDSIFDLDDPDSERCYSMQGDRSTKEFFNRERRKRLLENQQLFGPGRLECTFQAHKNIFLSHIDCELDAKHVIAQIEATIMMRQTLLDETVDPVSSTTQANPVYPQINRPKLNSLVLS